MGPTALLGFVPVIASAALGALYLSWGDGGVVLKVAGTGVFLLAAYLQFFSPYALAGVLLQSALALTLEIWRRLL